MTDTTEQKALAQAVAAAGRRMQDYAIMAEENVLRQSIEAHARAIEQLEAFRQEVSDAVENMLHGIITPHNMRRFIIAKPDPLVEVMRTEWPFTFQDGAEVHAACLRAAIERRGGKIVWGEG